MVRQTLFRPPRVTTLFPSNFMKITRSSWAKSAAQLSLSGVESAEETPYSARMQNGSESGRVSSKSRPLPAAKGLGGVRRKGARRGPRRTVTPPFFV